jgi:hypothetical protein
MYKLQASHNVGAAKVKTPKRAINGALSVQLCLSSRARPRDLLQKFVEPRSTDIANSIEVIAWSSRCWVKKKKLSRDRTEKTEVRDE